MIDRLKRDGKWNKSLVVVVADHGLRGLTHRAVDREAGLPEGSCSGYFRTRRALQTALTEYVARHLTEDVERLSATLARHPGDFERAVREEGSIDRYRLRP